MANDIRVSTTGVLVEYQDAGVAVSSAGLWVEYQMPGIALSSVVLMPEYSDSYLAIDVVGLMIEYSDEAESVVPGIFKLQGERVGLTYLQDPFNGRRRGQM